MDKNELKILALREEVSSQADRIADLRAELTISNERYKSQQEELTELRIYRQQREENDGLVKEEGAGTEDP